MRVILNSEDIPDRLTRKASIIIKVKNGFEKLIDKLSGANIITAAEAADYLN